MPANISPDVHTLIVAGFLLLQASLLIGLWRSVLAPLRRATDTIEKVGQLGLTGAAKVPGRWTALDDLLANLSYSANLRSIDEPGGRDRLSSSGAIELTGAVADHVTPGSLLPPAYNHRMDAAAPGLFTGLGILGTFAGMVYGFSEIEADQAMKAVPSLIQGLRVAFINSILGVALGLAWTIVSRRRRHQFDQSVVALRRALARKVTLRRTEDILSELLAPAMAAPFAEAASTIATFEGSLKQLGTIVDSTLRGLDSGAEKLATATLRFEAAGYALVHTTNRVETVLNRAADMADSATDAAQQLNVVRDALEQGSGALTGLISNLGGTREALVVTSDRLAEHADLFRAASRSLETTVQDINRAAATAVHESMTGVRDQLRDTIEAMMDKIIEAGETTVASYEKAAVRIADVIDERMTDSVDLIRAQLGTLAASIQQEVAKVHEAVGTTRSTMKEASAKLDAAAKSLATRSSDILTSQLNAYEKAVVEVIERFSGTLSLWNDRTDELEAAVRALEAHYARQNASGTT